MNFTMTAVLMIALLPFTLRDAAAQEPAANAYWPQFRGPNGSGVAADPQLLPAEFGPAKNLRWKTPLPIGNSSPCVWGERLFLTGSDSQKGKLETLCLDRKTGHILWRQAAPVSSVEKGHEMSTPANATPVTDGKRVYVVFGSYGILCYDMAGKELWKLPLPVPNVQFGTAASPILAGELLIVSADYPPKPVLLAVESRSGKTVWQKERVSFWEGYATPVLWRHAGGDEIVLHSPGRLSAYSLKDGQERWWVNIASTANSTPALGDGRLYVATWFPGGEQGDRVTLPAFEDLLQKYDKNADGKISKEEFPSDLSMIRRTEAADAGIPGADIKLVWFFGGLDSNKDGLIEKEEWAVGLALRPPAHGLLAVLPGGQGDVTQTGVTWKEERAIPEAPSPVFCDGRVYLVRDGGIVTCLDAKTGKILYRERVGAGGAYFASPIIGDGKLYVTSLNGMVTAPALGDRFKALARNDLGDRVIATPAIAQGTLYIRTEHNLYAFGK